tara:strand:+ start:191 stop:832 length:642 start_codon:yes stop_codon:yes gene_type:complete
MIQSHFTSDDFQSRANVSRETLEKLQVYADLLLKWQASINLVGPGTVPEIWHRHFYDSAQLFPYLVSDGPVIDMGSGAGFPGLVLAAMGRRNVTLIESNGKKCSFLRNVNRQLSLDVTICQSRIETCRSLPRAQYVVSRALAPLEMLLFYAHPLLADDGTCLFFKGRSVETELTSVKKNWTMQSNSYPSETDPQGVILTVGGLTPRYEGLETQ